MIVAIAALIAAQGVVTPPVPTVPLERIITANDYPAEALEQREEGASRVLLTINPQGRVTECRMLSSSGFSALDAWTCRLLSMRARFKPAMDAQGKPAIGTFEYEKIWKLPLRNDQA